MFFLLSALLVPLSVGAMSVQTEHGMDDAVLNDPRKFIFGRNLVTGERFFHDLTKIDEPTPVRRVRLMFSTSQAVTASKSVDVFHMRLRWVDPDFWNDNFTETGRSYKVLCEIEDENTGFARTFLTLTVDSAFNGYDEKYVFPRMPLIARCKVRAQNSDQLDSEWSLSPSIKIYELFSQPLESAKTLEEREEFATRYRHHHRGAKFWTQFRSA